MTEENQAPAQKNEGPVEDPERSRRTVEKYYIEVNASAGHKFLTGLLGGLGWGIGLTVGTALFLGIIGFVISKVDFVPIFGHFLSEVIKSAQGNLTAR